MAIGYSQGQGPVNKIFARAWPVDRGHFIHVSAIFGRTIQKDAIDEVNAGYGRFCRIPKGECRVVGRRIVPLHERIVLKD
jgi:hypothetical protein